MNDTNSGTAPSAPAVQSLLPHAQVIQMAGGSILAPVIYAVAELGIADRLKDGPRSSDEVAQVTDTTTVTLTFFKGHLV